MNTQTPLKNLQVSVACGPVPCDTEEGRLVLQQRQALFGKVSFLSAFGLFLIVHLLTTARGLLPPSALFTELGSLLHLGVCGIFLAVYLICRQERPLGARWLAAVDLNGAFAVGVLCGLGYFRHGGLYEFEQSWMLGPTHMLLCRAIIVPSAVGQTAVISLLTMVPVVVGYYLGFAPTSGVREGAIALDNPGGLSATFLASWSVVTVVMASVASHVLYGLRQEVEEARQLGQYTLEKRVGSGGMGDVYRASHALLRRPTAIKLLRPGISDERSLARFEREVQLTSLLTHPNTIAIYDYGRTPEGQFYYAMEYLDGIDLEALVNARGPLPPARIIHVLRQVCASLAEAHDSGLIHRDVKPANIVLCERGGMRDVVKVVDFGLVKDTVNTSDVNVSAANTITGTPLYLAPEAIRTPETVDARSDLYAVGAVGYFLLTGKRLFEGENFMEICGHQLNTIPQTPSARAGQSLPADLERIVMQCLEKDPAKRPQSARELCQALDGFADSGGWKAGDADRWWQEVAPAIKASGQEFHPSEDSETVEAAATVTDPRGAMV